MQESFATIERLRELGHVRTERHPTLPLTVVKYTDGFVRRGLWDRRMLTMRGAVYDDAGRCVSQPLRKFFNLGEKPTPTGSYRVQRKLDGTCICVFRHDGEPIVHTLGSFVSTQAAAAREHIERHYGWDWMMTLPGLTYMFEWMDADNFTTLRHRGEPRLVLFALLVNGREMFTAHGWDRFVVNSRNGWHGPIVEDVPYADLDALAANVPDDEEGYVLIFDTFSAGQYPRMKIKGARYLAISRAKWGLTERVVWDCTFGGNQDGEAVRGQLDEEARAWFDAVRDRMLAEVATLENDAREHHTRIVREHDGFLERIEAAKALPDVYRHAVLMWLNGKAPKVSIFHRAVRPAGTTGYAPSASVA